MSLLIALNHHQSSCGFRTWGVRWPWWGSVALWNWDSWSRRRRPGGETCLLFRISTLEGWKMLKPPSQVRQKCCLPRKRETTRKYLEIWHIKYENLCWKIEIWGKLAVDGDWSFWPTALSVNAKIRFAVNHSNWFYGSSLAVSNVLWLKGIVVGCCRTP